MLHDNIVWTLQKLLMANEPECLEQGQLGIRTDFTWLTGICKVFKFKQSAVPCTKKQSKQLAGFKMSKTLKTLKNGVFWVVTPCGSCKNRRFGGTWRLLHQGDKNR
jgi:hypothetical protein